jgi:hypothetical protein
MMDNGHKEASFLMNFAVAHYKYVVQERPRTISKYYALLVLVLVQ